MPSLPKMVWSVGMIIGLLLILIVLYYFIYRLHDSNEGFYPVNEERIHYEQQGKRRYNDYADMMDIERVSIIPNGKDGDKAINGLLNTPAFEGDKDSPSLAGPNYANELPYKPPPTVGTLIGRIKRCQSVTSWDCSALDDPEFLEYCGICTDKGQDHLGNPHIGGLYIDPTMKEQEKTKAASAGKKPQYVPTTGTCKGEFIGERPYCDVQKDRFECSQAQSFTSEAAKAKCALCAFNPSGNLFVYTGSRGNIDTNYALTGNPSKFPARLRFAVTHPNEASITVTRNSDQKTYVGSFIPNTNVYLCDIPECVENELFNILIKYPDYAPYNWTEDDKKRINTITTPNFANLVRASYGPQLSGDDAFLNDDPRAVDVSAYIKSKFNINNCSNTAINVSNDGLGGDPNPGIYKQLRLVYGNNGTDFAYSYGTEGGTTKPINTAAFNTLCPTPIPVKDAEKTTCETDAGGNIIAGRIYTGGNNQGYYGAGTTFCITETQLKPRGVVGIWESKGRVPRQVPLDLSVTMVNGLIVGDEGVYKMGTIKGSSTFKSIPLSKVPGVPVNLFWFWSKKKTLTTCDIQIAVPATLRDPTVAEDLKLCPTGPLITTQAAATRLNHGACEKLVNGLAQAPGTYTDECIRTLFLSSGCSKDGSAYPNSSEKAAAFTRDPVSNNNNSIDDISDAINNVYTIATTGSNTDGLKVELSSYAKANQECFGITITNPCDTAFKDTGPHTAECLDYLFRDAGKSNPKIGSTYTGVFNRSSGTNRTEKTPIMYCQRSGSLAPIDINGKTNDDAITTANSYGSVNAVKNFYKQIHYDANFNSDPSNQQIALGQCYGVNVKAAKQVCKGTKARYVRILPALNTNNNNIQISQIEVYNVNDVNVSTGKKTKSSKSLAASSANAVDGRAQPRFYPDLFISENDVSENKSDKYWQVDLGQTEEIAYVVFTNAGGPADRAPPSRSVGMRIQLVDQDESVVKQALLKGGNQETIMFSNAKPSGLLKIGTNISFIPSKYLGSALSAVAGGETLIQPFSNLTSAQMVFTAQSGNTPKSGGFSFKQIGTENYLRAQGFRIRLAPDDGTFAFKQESTFVISESVAGNPGEVSYESISSPGSYLAVSDNMGAYISPASGLSQQKACSWRIKMG